MRDVAISAGIAIDHAAVALQYAEETWLDNQREAGLQRAMALLESALADLRSARDELDAALR
jgi:hypothetical protein